MTTSTLDQLIAEVREAENDPDDFERQLEEVTAMWFAASKVYEANRKELSKLVRPLGELLPSVADYEAYAAPHDGKVAGPQWNTERFYTKAAKQLRIKNPGLVMCTQCNRGEGGASPEFSDEEFETFLDDVELMANWWEKSASATPVELAKSIIVHTVLESPELRDRALREAEAAVERLVQLDARLESWRDDL